MKVDFDQFSGPCSCGRSHSFSVKKVIIEPQATKHLDEILVDYRKPVFIYDANTRRAAEPSMSGYFERYDCLEVPGPNIHADNQHVAIVQQGLPADVDLLVAVGSGSIHDISRYIAHDRGIPFVSVPTAASVDGFVSTVAAMTWFGLKRTTPAVAPLYVLADSDIFTHAPYRLTASGIGDLMGKYTALLDWRVSHIVTGEYFCQRIYDLELAAVRKVESVLDKIKTQDRDSTEELMYALLLSGLAMQMIGNSRPASGAEHHVSHLWEMEVLNDRLDALHGEKVGIGLLLCLQRYERIRQAIRRGTCRVIASPDFETKLLQETFGKKGLYEGILEENGENVLAGIQPDVLRERLPEIAAELEKLPNASEMQRKLSAAGCLTSMTEIGLPETLRDITLQLCPYVRRRLTLLRMSKMLVLEG